MPDRRSDPPPDLGAPAPPAAARVGSRAALATTFVHAMTKAARAFTLYDPSNALIRQFLAEYRARAEAATAAGPLVLEVRAHDLLHDRDVVYHDDDREKSLAFRLYRDGVRRLTFLPGPSFAELVRLLEILAIRLGGIREAEDDVVTLLRKAELTTLEILAVDEYTSEEDEAGTAYGRGSPLAPELDPTFDTPAPPLPAPAAVVFRDVPADVIARLRREEDPANTAPSALAVAGELLVLGSQGALPAAEVARFCAELRDFLVADRQLAPLAALADLIRREAGERIRDELMRTLGDPGVLEVVLASIPAGATALPPNAARLLPFVPSSAVIDRLAREGEARRAALVALVAARLPADADAVLARLGSIPAPVARALAKVLEAKAPARAVETALVLVEHPDEGLRIEALAALGALPRRIAPDRLVRLLDDPSAKVRCAAAAALERHGDASAARALADALERRQLSREEGAAFARAFGKLKPAIALKLFREWLPARRGLFRGLRTSDREDARRWAAVAGLGAVGDTDALERVAAVAAEADAELRRHCDAVLARAREEAGHG
jgi:HEAT repeat protein